MCVRLLRWNDLFVVVLTVQQPVAAHPVVVDGDDPHLVDVGHHLARIAVRLVIAGSIALIPDQADKAVELVVSDWATLVQNRSKPEVYEVFITGHSGYSHPATQPFNDKGWPGFWDSAEKDKILSDMVAEPDPAKQKKIIDDYQALIWREMPFVKCGDNFLLRGVRKELKGYVNPPDWFFWNGGLG